MKINRENYESFLLDFKEGRLSGKDMEMVREFLMLNPELEQEIEELELAILEPDYFSYPLKNSLKKSFQILNEKPEESNFELFAIAYHENDLTLDQRMEFEHFVRQKRVYKLESELWKKTRLEPENIKYPLKRELKKPVRKINRAIRILIPTAIAASFAVMIMIFQSNPEAIESTVKSEMKSDIDDQPIQLAVAESKEAQKSTNPIILSAKERPIHPELSGEKNSNKTRTKDQPAQEQSPGEHAGQTEDLKLGSSYQALAGEGINRRVIAEFQPDYDRIQPLKLPSTPVHFVNLSLKEMAKLDAEDIVEEITEEEFTILNVAKVGIGGVNRLVGSDMQLLASKDKSGEVSGFHFRSKRLNILAPIDKSARRE